MKEMILFHIMGLMIGVFLDQVIGDPHFMPHPVRAVGRLILLLERKFLGEGDKLQQKKSGVRAVSGGRGSKRVRFQGVITWLVVVITTVTVTFGALFAAYKLNRYLGVAAEAVLTCYILAARSLSRESMKVLRCLKRGDIEASRYALSMIVGRDTDCLDEEGISKAAVETVAENTSDGVIAPLIYTALGGPVLGMLYKAVNTMDSMLGYRSERYEDFGYFAARADDAFNFVPSRFSAVMMIAGTFILQIFSNIYSGKRAFRIWRRDRLKHSSPNSAQTESACAGALGLRLGGTHLYGGVEVFAPTIGDETRKASIDDIKRANNLMFMTEALTVVIILAGAFAPNIIK